MTNEQAIAKLILFRRQMLTRAQTAFRRGDRTQARITHGEIAKVIERIQSGESWMDAAPEWLRSHMEAK